MMIEQYEIDFLKAIEKKFNKWINQNDIQLPKYGHGDEEHYSLVIKDFLHLEIMDVQGIFEQRYDRRLIQYFIDNYACTSSKGFGHKGQILCGDFSPC